MKILLMGKNGQVGTELAQLLPRLGKLFGFDWQELELTKPDEIRRTIRNIRPQIIVNAAAYTAVDKAEEEESFAYRINAEAPRVMAEESKNVGALLVHYSTDYIFDGLKTSPYTEEDSPNPINAYGRTKLSGEQAIRASGVPHLIFRTAWLYATRGKNFLLTILRLATQREELRIVHDQFGAPAWSRVIAWATTKVLEQVMQQGSFKSALSRVGSTYHMTAAGVTNWYEFALAILEEAALLPRGAPWFEAATDGKPLIARRVIPISTPDYPTPARRPAYSVLSNSRLQRDFGIELPHWRVQLRSAMTRNR